jgi:hypothetical protein
MVLLMVILRISTILGKPYSQDNEGKNKYAKQNDDGQAIFLFTHFYDLLQTLYGEFRGYLTYYQRSNEFSLCILLIKQIYRPKIRFFTSAFYRFRYYTHLSSPGQRKRLKNRIPYHLLFTP